MVETAAQAQQSEKQSRPRVMIEEFLPVEEIGAESLRDNSAAIKPPINRLHVWWARRPLTVSRAAILASLLPADTDPLWFLETIGIHGNPAETRRQIEAARKTGADLGANVYGYPRAFTTNLSPERAAEVRAKLRETWGATT